MLNTGMTVLGVRMAYISASAFPVVKFCNFQKWSNPKNPSKIQDGSAQTFLVGVEANSESDSFYLGLV